MEEGCTRTRRHTMGFISPVVPFTCARPSNFRFGRACHTFLVPSGCLPLFVSFSRLVFSSLATCVNPSHIEVNRIHLFVAAGNVRINIVYFFLRDIITRALPGQPVTVSTSRPLPQPQAKSNTSTAQGSAQVP